MWDAMRMTKVSAYFAQGRFEPVHIPSEYFYTTITTKGEQRP